MRIHPNPESDNFQSADDWSLAQCFQALYRRKVLVAGITGIGVLAAAFFSLALPRWYQSQASLELQGINENYLDLHAVYPNTPASDSDGTYLQTEADILQDDSLIRQVALRLHLQDHPEWTAHAGWLQPGPVTPAQNLQALTDAVKQRLSVTFNHGSRILRITAEARDPKLAAGLANELAAVYIEQNLAQRRQAATRTYTALRSQLAGIRSRLDRAEARLKGAPAAPGAAREEAAAERRFYEATAESANQAELASTMAQSNIRLVSAAVPASRPFKPNVPLNFAIGIFGGLLLAIGWVLLREQASSALRAPGEAAAYLPVPELGVIPDAGRGSGVGRFRRSDSLPPVERAAAEQRLSPVSEAIRATVATIVNTAGAKGRSRVLVVTSSQPMEGKTTVVANLAAALSEISGRVLLVDGDMRRPRLHAIFDQPNTWGLSDMLREKNAIEELPVEALVKKTAVPHLYLLPSGAAADNVFGLLYSARMEKLMPRFRDEFDYVLIDSPPCLEFADARIMARYADGLLLVIRADYTGRAMAQNAVRQLLLDGLPVSGAILNRWNPAYGRSYAYGYSGPLARRESR